MGSVTLRMFTARDGAHALLLTTMPFSQSYLLPHIAGIFSVCIVFLFQNHIYCI